jgi:hypothetical protein
MTEGRMAISRNLHHHVNITIALPASLIPDDCQRLSNLAVISRGG